MLYVHEAALPPSKIPFIECDLRLCELSVHRVCVCVYVCVCVCACMYVCMYVCMYIYIYMYMYIYTYTE